MALEKSPSLEEYATGIPSPAPVSPRWRIGLFLLGVIGVALLATGVLTLVLFWGEDLSFLLGHTGVVSGVVVDEIYRPLQADIYIQLTNLHTRCDANGHFEIRGVPAGPRSIVVAYRGRAQAFPVTVIGGINNQVGQLRFVPTAPIR
ncbi:MAG: hypothetical protein DDG58_02495 [Ardenticatenia bacterium]|nr:MAG: hypothetical protein DDG58_02495 [Ardenticatenia bacterium]